MEESAKGLDLVSGPRQHIGAAATENYIVLVSGDAPILDETCHSPHSVAGVKDRRRPRGFAGNSCAAKVAQAGADAADYVAAAAYGTRDCCIAETSDHMLDLIMPAIERDKEPFYFTMER